MDIYSQNREKPIRVLLNKSISDKMKALANSKNMMISDIIREAIEYAYSNRDQVGKEIEKLKIPVGQEPIRFNGDNKKIFSFLVNKRTDQLCCNTTFVLNDCRVVLSKGCSSVKNENGKLVISVITPGTGNKEKIIFCTDSVKDVTVVNSLSNKRSTVLPPRLETLAEYEYIEIVMR